MQNPRRFSRRQLLKGSGAAALGGAVLIVVGCDGDETTPPPTTPTDGTPEPGTTPTDDSELVVAQATLWSTLDQEFSVDHENQEAQANQGARLIRYPYVQDPERGPAQDVSGNFEPELAESWEVSDDRTTYTFHLRRDVVSPAGNELTADDVMWTMERVFAINAIRAFVLGPLAMQVFSMDQITRVDDYTVRFQLEQPFDTFLHGAANPFGGTILDSQLIQANAPADDPWAMDWVANNTSGFGAYSVQSFTAGDQALWVANENYVHGAPPIKRMTWRVVPDSSSRLSLVLRGDVHIAKQMLSREQDSAEGQAGVTIPQAFTNLSVFIPLQMGGPPFDETRVRQAFLHTIPYDEIINTVYRGRARRQFGMLWEPIPGAAPEHWERYTTDIQRARDLLAEAGFPDGVSTDLGYSLATPDMEEVAILIRDSAAQAGFRINIRGLTPSAMNEQNNTQEGMTRLIRDFAIVPTAVYNLNLFFAPDQPLNWANYNPPRAQAEEFWNTMQDVLAVGDDLAAEAQTLLNQAQQTLAEDSPFAWICWVDPPHIFRDNVQGYHHRTDNTLDYALMSFS